MSPRLLGDIKTVAILSRYEHLAVAMNCIIDSSVMPVSSAGLPQIINRGEVLAAYVPDDESDHVGKYRPYAESVVAGAFAENSVNFTLTPAQRGAQWFIPGDVIETTAGVAIGTIATYNPATGVGTFTEDSEAVVAIGASVRLVSTNWGLANKLGLILEDEVLVEYEFDLPTSAYREGFFNQSMTSLTTAAIASLGAAVENTINGYIEVRVQ